jgi:Uma2 family endonuclease
MSTLPVPAPLTDPALAEPSPEAGVSADIDYDALVTEDQKPVDRIFIEKLYRLLTRTLYESWPGPGPGRTFLVLANVGWFYQDQTPAVAPDILLSLDAKPPLDLHVKQGHSYYQWAQGKQPDVIIEAVSNRTGGEESFKKNLYARLGVPYYVVFDPDHYLSEDTLRAYELVAGTYRLGSPGPWPNIGLGLCLWEGQFEGVQDVWLRWCDADGKIVLTAEERLRQAEERNRELEAELRRLKGQSPEPQ